jgi:hypothetical protein
MLQQQCGPHKRGGRAEEGESDISSIRAARLGAKEDVMRGMAELTYERRKNAVARSALAEYLASTIGLL